MAKHSLQDIVRSDSPELFDEDLNLVSEEECGKLDPKLNDDSIGGRRIQAKKPLFRKSISGSCERERDTKGQDERDHNESTVIKDKRNILSRRSSNMKIQSQESIQQREGQNCVVTNQVGRYSLRNHTPTKRELETKNRTSKAIQNISGLDENKQSVEETDTSGATDRLMGERDAAKDTKDFSGR